MEKTGWLKNFVFHYGMTRSEREEILLDWNELADKYGMSLLSSPFIEFSFLFKISYNSCGKEVITNKGWVSDRNMASLLCIILMELVKQQFTASIIVVEIVKLQTSKQIQAWYL